MSQNTRGELAARKHSEKAEWIVVRDALDDARAKFVMPKALSDSPRHTVRTAAEESSGLRENAQASFSTHPGGLPGATVWDRLKRVIGVAESNDNYDVINYYALG